MNNKHKIIVSTAAILCLGLAIYIAANHSDAPPAFIPDTSDSVALLGNAGSNIGSSDPAVQNLHIDVLSDFNTHTLPNIGSGSLMEISAVLAEGDTDDQEIQKHEHGAMGNTDEGSDFHNGSGNFGGGISFGGGSSGGGGFHSHSLNNSHDAGGILADSSGNNLSSFNGDDRHTDGNDNHNGNGNDDHSGNNNQDNHNNNDNHGGNHDDHNDYTDNNHHNHDDGNLVTNEIPPIMIAVPEPMTYGIVGAITLGLMIIRRRYRR